ncbi:hypothetical protein BS50DRAFT_575064 [Corynespora cassiicola Philippines]|uniref:Uncharacterized protein n=1 Tax=Corynespora cassiicola Philippines TaxID=1448308 RepID=A0A2T2NHM2_CORCC|nr:hypothetical protein BS50DRAFT_575064 [Corynespora cassiicola Philippines]
MYVADSHLPDFPLAFPTSRPMPRRPVRGCAALRSGRIQGGFGMVGELIWWWQRQAAATAAGGGRTYPTYLPT